MMQILAKKAKQGKTKTIIEMIKLLSKKVGSQLKFAFRQGPEMSLLLF